MNNLNIEYAFNRLELAIRTNDTSFIIECCDELLNFNELSLNSQILLSQILSLCHLKNQCFLKSYLAIDRSIKLEPTVNNQLILDVIKTRISE